MHKAHLCLRIFAFTVPSASNALPWENFWCLSCLCSQVIVTPWTAACQASLSFTISQSFLKLMSFELVMPSNHLILCCPLLLPSVFPIIRVFSNESVLCIKWPKYWSFSLSINLSGEYFGLISFRIAVQGTLKSFLNTTIQKHQFLVLNLLYGPTLTSIHDYWKTIPLTRWTFVGKVMSLLFNILS